MQQETSKPPSSWRRKYKPLWTASAKSVENNPLPTRNQPREDNVRLSNEVKTGPWSRGDRAEIRQRSQTEVGYRVSGCQVKNKGAFRETDDDLMSRGSWQHLKGGVYRHTYKPDLIRSVSQQRRTGGEKLDF
ncbi:Hypothetical predicted protein [Xyrichtys novacula]|uniref:Uncharacterized protein n=1 Tax=Xyrichtys novacula TaxID=13765 RepID=A0AAV1GXS7_XYRNO|nr:Hypothetical predicted protein [Xyrichtys novacula]